MKTKIFKIELSNLKNDIILWTSLIISYLVLLMLLYPLYSKNQPFILELLNATPKYLLKMFGVAKDTLFTETGYYAFIFGFILFLGALEASIFGIKIIAHDKEAHTDEFLFTKPVLRHNVLTIKILASLFGLFITNIIFNILSFILLNIYADTNLKNIELFQINTALILSQLSFFAISMTIAAFIKKPKTIVTAVSVVIFCYVLSMIERLYSLTFLRYINPFSYFQVSDILKDGQYKYSFVVATLFILVFCFNFTYRGYETKDVIE